MSSEVHVSAAELEAGLPEIQLAPDSEGTVELIVRRPAEGEREVLDEAELDLDEGLVGDRWRSSARTNDEPVDTSAQLTLMSARVIALIAPERERWPLAGDQLYVDLDLRPHNLAAGTRLTLGSAVIEVTDVPHTGCAKFSARFGSAATRFVNSPRGRALRLRGMNARVLEPGRVRRGDTIRKLAFESATGLGPPPLGGTHWTLVELEGVWVELGEDESAPYLMLDTESSRLSGSGGCNQLAGSYELSDDGLRFGPVAPTRMACPDAVMQREAGFLSALAKATGHRLDGSSLALRDGDHVVARLTATVAPVS